MSQVDVGDFARASGYVSLKEKDWRLRTRYLRESGWDLFNCPNCDMGYWYKQKPDRDYPFWHALVCSGKKSSYRSAQNTLSVDEFVTNYQVVDDEILEPPEDTNEV
jgi:hypothetical protein